MSIQDDPPVTATSVKRAITAANSERAHVSSLTGVAIQLHTVPAAIERLDDFTREERCGTDLIADALSRHLYGRSYDELPADARRRVEAAALHAIRAAQLTWNREASERATDALDRAMCQELGLPYSAQPLERRKALARIGATVVQAALRGVLDLEHPFAGPGQAIAVYDAAEAEAKQVMARKGGAR